MTDIFLRSAPGPDVTLRDPSAADAGGSGSDSATPSALAWSAVSPTESGASAAVAASSALSAVAPTQGAAEAATTADATVATASPSEAGHQSVTTSTIALGASSAASSGANASVAASSSFTAIPIAEGGASSATTPSIATSSAAVGEAAVGADAMSTPTVVLSAVTASDDIANIVAPTSGGGGRIRGLPPPILARHGEDAAIASEIGLDVTQPSEAWTFAPIAAPQRTAELPPISLASRVKAPIVEAPTSIVAPLVVQSVERGTLGDEDSAPPTTLDLVAITPGEAFTRWGPARDPWRAARAARADRDSNRGARAARRKRAA